MELHAFLLTTLFVTWGLTKTSGSIIDQPDNETAADKIDIHQMARELALNVQLASLNHMLQTSINEVTSLKNQLAVEQGKVTTLQTQVASLSNRTPAISLSEFTATNSNSRYFFSHDTETWSGAIISCQLLGGYLVEIETAEEYKFLHDKCASLQAGSRWVALSDKRKVNVWEWATSHAIYNRLKLVLAAL